MRSICLAALLQLSLVSADAETYAEAYRLTTEMGGPMLILVSAEWCPACHKMQRDVLPQIRDRGLLRGVAFAVVNLDHERELGRTLTRGGPIPQLLMFRKAPEGWRLSRLIGGQSVRVVERFISQGLRREQSARKGAKQEGKLPSKAGSQPDGEVAPAAENGPSPTS